MSVRSALNSIGRHDLASLDRIQRGSPGRSLPDLDRLLNPGYSYAGPGAVVAFNVMNRPSL